MRRFLLLTVFIISLLALIACGQKTDTPSSGGGQQTGSSSGSTGGDSGTSEGNNDGAIEKKSLEVGSSVRDIGMLPLYVADQKGFFKDEGLDVTVHYFNSGSEHMQALVANAIDIGSGGFQEPIDGYIAKQPIKAFWGLTNYPIYEWWSLPDLKTIDDVKKKGKVKVAVSKVGSLSHLISVYALEKAGIDPDKEAEFVGLGGPGARLAGLQSGQVDMIPATPPGNYILGKQGFNQLIVLKELMDEFQYEVMYAKEDLLKNNPNTMRAFVRGISKATDFIRENPEESGQILSDVVGYKPEELEDTIRAVQEMGDYFPADGHFAEEGIEMLLQFTVDSGDLPSVPPHSDLIDYTFTNEMQGK